MFTVNGEKLSPTSFPDKTCSLRLHARDDAYKIDWKYDGDHECMLLWNLVHHIRANNGENTPIGLYMPYVPNARMDRVKNCDEVFTLKWFAEFINSLHFSYVQVFDPHSNVSEALINHVEPIAAHDCIESVIDELNGKRNMDVLLCYPDEGAAKRYSDDVVRAKLLGDFSMRGQESVESATKSSAAFCLSFLNTATVPAILWLEHNYACRVENDKVAYGALSTEHSVMCSNFAIDGDEITHIRRLLKEVYPHQNFSMVSDSYDYWNLVDKILPEIKQDVLAHDGCLAIRGDSGDPVEIVTETVFHLWDTFGGTVNSKGFKVLDPYVKALYGDSITPQRCEAIYQILMDHGFAINNVSLGVGSFSMQCLETMDSDSKVYAPYTRDTFGIAVKATYAEDYNGKPIMIFKNPKTDSGHFKKSQRGCCCVHRNLPSGTFTYIDGLTWEQAQEDNELKPVFKNGKLLRVFTLDEVRHNLHGGEF